MLAYAESTMPRAVESGKTGLGAGGVRCGERETCIKGGRSSCRDGCAKLRCKPSSARLFGQLAKIRGCNPGVHCVRGEGPPCPAEEQEEKERERERETERDSKKDKGQDREARQRLLQSGQRKI